MRARDEWKARAESAEASCAAMRTTLQQIHTLECPCCGDLAAWPTMFCEGDRIICGCPGQIAVGDDDAYVLIDEDVPCTKCDDEERARKECGR